MISGYLNDSNIFIVVFYGDICLKDVEDFLYSFGLIDYLPGDVMLLYDFTDAIFKIPPENLQKIADLANEATKKYRSVKTAFFVLEPLITAYSYLFSELNNNSNTKRQVFSTFDAATNWLLNDHVIKNFDLSIN